MTVIAYRDGVMAADRASFTEYLRFESAFPKIARGPDGSLAGATGSSVDAYAFLKWFAAGEIGPEPSYTEGDDQPSFLIARPDGSLWRQSGPASRRYPESSPMAVGAISAATFCLGAMAAGCTAAEAVSLTIKSAIYTGCGVHVERLSR